MSEYFLYVLIVQSDNYSSQKCIPTKKSNDFEYILYIKLYKMENIQLLALRHRYHTQRRHPHQWSKGILVEGTPDTQKYSKQK